MGFGGSFSKLLEKVKHPAAKGRRKQERRESGITGEKVDFASSATQPEPHAATEDRHDREGNGIGVKETHVDLCQEAEVEVEVKSVPSREEQDVDGKKIDPADPPAASTPSIDSHNGKPDSMWKNLLQFLPLTAPSGTVTTSSPLLGPRDSSLPSDDVETSAVPDHIQDALSPDQDEPTVADQNKPDEWKFVAYPTAKLFLGEGKESADASDPLKYVVAGLCFILENCEVRPFSRIHYP